MNTSTKRLFPIYLTMQWSLLAGLIIRQVFFFFSSVTSHFFCLWYALSLFLSLSIFSFLLLSSSFLFFSPCCDLLQFLFLFYAGMLNSVNNNNNKSNYGRWGFELSRELLTRQDSAEDWHTLTTGCKITMREQLEAAVLSV